MFGRKRRVKVYIDNDVLSNYVKQTAEINNTFGMKALKSVGLLFTPTSAISILIVGFILNLLVTDEMKTKCTFINYLTTKKDVLSLLLVFWLILTIVLEVANSKIKNLEMEILSCNNKIQDYENDKKNADLLLRNKLSSFLKNGDKTILEKFIKQTVKNNNFIDSAQIYTYTVFRSMLDCEVKCNFIIGYAREQFEINSIMQIYYIMNTEHYKQLITIRNELKILKDSSISRKKYIRSLIGLLIKCSELSEEITNYYKKIELNKKEVISSIEIIALLNILIYEVRDCIVEEKENMRKIEDFKDLLGALNKREEEITKLNTPTFKEKSKYKRTGLLAATVTEDIFAFKNETSYDLNKKGRTYVTYSFLFRSKQYIALYSVNKEYAQDCIDLNKDIDRLKTEFLSELKFYE